MIRKRKLYDEFGHAAFDGSMGPDPAKTAEEFRKSRTLWKSAGFRRALKVTDNKEVLETLEVMDNKVAFKAEKAMGIRGVVLMAAGFILPEVIWMIFSGIYLQ